jgi:hypothetical protein
MQVVGLEVSLLGQAAEVLAAKPRPAARALAPALGSD